MKNKMRGILIMEMVLVLYGTVLALFVITLISSYVYDKKLGEVYKAEEIFKQEYIKKHPEMISLINKYNSCKNQSYEVIECCISNATKDFYKKEKLKNYIYLLEKSIAYKKDYTK